MTGKILPFSMVWAALMTMPAADGAALNDAGSGYNGPATVQRDTGFGGTKPGIFGSTERFSKRVKRFDKWNDLLDRIQNDPEWTANRAAFAAGEIQETSRKGCSRSDRLECNRAAWEGFIANEQSTKGLDLLNSVNLFMNESPYIVDPVNWNLPDYWATPREFFLKDGDCEDYAFSKYVTLKRMGWPTDTMRIVVLQDENLRVAHAILSVEFEGEIYVLDNQTNTVLPHTKISHYRPVYSINEQGWWLHLGSSRRRGR